MVTHILVAMVTHNAGSHGYTYIGSFGYTYTGSYGNTYTGNFYTLRHIKPKIHKILYSK